MRECQPTLNESAIMKLENILWLFLIIEDKMSGVLKINRHFVCVSNLLILFNNIPNPDTPIIQINTRIVSI